MMNKQNSICSNTNDAIDVIYHDRYIEFAC